MNLFALPIFAFSIALEPFVADAVPFHDFISSLSDKVNELKQAILAGQSSTRSIQLDPSVPSITDRFLSRDPNKIRFLLYDKRLNPNEYTEVRVGDIDTFKARNFQNNKPVKFLVHGFNHNATEGPGSFPNDAKDAYLEKTDYNVICVDWGELAKPKKIPGVSPDVFYPVVVSNVPHVGEEFGKLLVFMLESELIRHPDQIHIVGFSLGAHIAGLAGTYVKDKMSNFIGRITGLDPASPMFERAVDSERLDKSDADFVDVIHSSRLGLYERIGHVDFYVNGGRTQIDCYQLDEDTNARQAFSEFARAVMGSCGHSRAPFYYTYSIKSGPGAIAGCGCPTWRDYLTVCRKQCRGIVNFGEHCPPTARGVYFLEITVDDVKA